MPEENKERRRERERDWVILKSLARTQNGCLRASSAVGLLAGFLVRSRDINSLASSETTLEDGNMTSFVKIWSSTSSGWLLLTFVCEWNDIFSVAQQSRSDSCALWFGCGDKRSKIQNPAEGFWKIGWSGGQEKSIRVRLCCGDQRGKLTPLIQTGGTRRAQNTEWFLPTRRLFYCCKTSVLGAPVPGRTAFPALTSWSFPGVHSALRRRNQLSWQTASTDRRSHCRDAGRGGRYWVNGDSWCPPELIWW